MKFLVGLLSACLVLFLFGLYMGSAYGAPIVQATAGGVVITLTDEPCVLAAVKNLPYRATWGEKGTIFDGCWAQNGDVIAAYFDDRTVAVIPLSAFRRVNEVSGSQPRRVLM